MKKIVAISAAVALLSVVSVVLILIVSSNIEDASTELNMDELLIEDEGVAFGAEVSYDAWLNLVCEGGGAIEVSPYQMGYSYGTRVTFTPRSLDGWEFESWSGDVPENLIYEKDLSFSLYEGEYNITAIFKKK